MSLRERLAQADAEAAPLLTRSGRVRNQRRRSIIRSLHFLIIEEMGDDIDRAESPAAMRHSNRTTAAGADRARSRRRCLIDRPGNDITQAVLDNILGYGPINALSARTRLSQR